MIDLIVINDREKTCLIRSAVAGLSSWNSRLAPLSFLALLTASFTSILCQALSFQVDYNLIGFPTHFEPASGPGSLTKYNPP